ncbi:hypothetical protein HC891_16040 [Candidatus Gracilibacteria bacterium]|nr:hypothetical protein [Candidatus Gracilibacteria bacterium]
MWVYRYGGKGEYDAAHPRPTFPPTMLSGAIGTAVSAGLPQCRAVRDMHRPGRATPEYGR